MFYCSCSSHIFRLSRHFIKRVYIMSKNNLVISAIIVWESQPSGHHVDVTEVVLSSVVYPYWTVFGGQRQAKVANWVQEACTSVYTINTGALTALVGIAAVITRIQFCADYLASLPFCNIQPLFLVWWLFKLNVPRSVREFVLEQSFEMGRVVRGTGQSSAVTPIEILQETTQTTDAALFSCMDSAAIFYRLKEGLQNRTSYGCLREPQGPG
ncbi:hypothetical protein OE88DRAFT_1648778 [Heliocybe sulcata]|uniref:Uncharacterized protein n=1 Tax=Heliocybe sulcata TaxID=5364 RepID=A0A5C3MLP3_9AGAM|nr:hypothetical protein OE88DRAFT_1648778 [Heliocybe sulcata]